MNKKSMILNPVLILAMVSLACKFFTPDSMDVSQNSKEVADFLPFDTQTPLPSPGAAALRILAEDEPGVAALVDDVEAAERAALEAVLEELKLQTGADGITEPVGLGLISPFTISNVDHPIIMGTSAEGALLPVIYSGHFSPPAEDGNESGGFVMGELVSMFSDVFVSEMPAFPNRTSSETATTGDVTTTMNTELGREDDGSTTFSMGFQTEGTKNGVSVKTDNSAKVTGQRCPDANGQVNFTITARSGSESGGTGQTQDLTAVVQATVNDDGEISDSQIDIVQGTRQVKDGRQAYVETGMTVKYKGANFEKSDQSEITVIHVSQDVTPDDDLSAPGLTSALRMGIASLGSARYAWQNGTCTAIKAISPGSVQPGSTTEIPVKVLSRIDGSEIAAKLLAELTGEESVDPASLAKTPGTLTYTAPGEKGKSATILLTATSRRGIAKLELTANTGGRAYKGTVHLERTSCTSSQRVIIDADITFELSPDNWGPGIETYIGQGQALMSWDPFTTNLDQSCEGNSVGFPICAHDLPNSSFSLLQVDTNNSTYFGLGFCDQPKTIITCQGGSGPFERGDGESLLTWFQTSEEWEFASPVADNGTISGTYSASDCGTEVWSWNLIPE